MTNTELRQKFNIKELLERSNEKIDKWSKWCRALKNVEDIYIQTEDNYIIIRGIHSSRVAQFREDIQTFRELKGLSRTVEFTNYFEKTYDCNPTHIVAQGLPKNIDKINTLIVNFLGITTEQLSGYIKKDFTTIINSLEYKDFISIIVKPLNYRKLTFV